MIRTQRHFNVHTTSSQRYGRVVWTLKQRCVRIMHGRKNFYYNVYFISRKWIAVEIISDWLFYNVNTKVLFT